LKLHPNMPRFSCITDTSKWRCWNQLLVMQIQFLSNKQDMLVPPRHNVHCNCDCDCDLFALNNH